MAHPPTEKLRTLCEFQVFTLGRAWRTYADAFSLYYSSLSYRDGLMAHVMEWLRLEIGEELDRYQLVKERYENHGPMVILGLKRGEEPPQTDSWPTWVEIRLDPDPYRPLRGQSLDEIQHQIYLCLNTPGGRTRELQHVQDWSELPQRIAALLPEVTYVASATDF